jgi:hypothetical protein
VVPGNFQDSQKNAYQNSSFGWVELNIILFFLISEIFQFSLGYLLYFRTEGVNAVELIVVDKRLRVYLHN